MPDILSPDGFARVKELFLACVDLPREEQQQHLDEACGSDETLKEQVWRMLKSQPSKIVVETDVVDPAACMHTTVLGATIGESIGHYKLLEQLGEGGMGIVYVAEQKVPIRRHVALKVIKPGMDTKQVIARFEAERQALSMMEHQNIARIFDGGATPEGRPYFVMELVRGIPITEFCDNERFTIRQRLELFIQVCQAVQHAHQKGIIHRDLKPSNILVTRHDETAVPKVIDFGIAKAVNQSLTDKTIYTQFAQFIGTPLYMSPEQAELSGLDIDTRSDVYSLGVLLYELLTGTTPFDAETLKQKGLDEMRRMIREDEPPQPSARISTLNAQAGSTISQRRNVDSRKLRQTVRGELDWIVMKTLQKDRMQRYESASALAADVMRYINFEPVEASPPSRLYRARKFARRNRTMLAVLSAIFLAIYLGAGVSAWQAVEAIKARTLAEKSAEESNSVLKFFSHKVLSAVRPADDRGGLGIDTRLREAIDSAEPDVATAFKDHPLAEAAIRETLGNSYWSLGQPEAAIKQHERSLELRRKNLAPDHPDIISSTHNLASAYRAAGRLNEAIALFSAAFEKSRAVHGKDDSRTLTSMTCLGSAYKSKGQLERAVGLLEQTQKLATAKHGPNHDRTLSAKNALAMAYDAAGFPERALPLYEQAHEGYLTRYGPTDLHTLALSTNLAIAYCERGKRELAMNLCEKALEASAPKLGENHPETISMRTTLGGAYWQSGRVAEAIALLTRTLAVSEAILGHKHPQTLVTKTTLADAQKAALNFEAAATLYKDVAEQLRVAKGYDHPETMRCNNNLAMIYLEERNFNLAIPLLKSTLAARRKKLGDTHPDTAHSMNNLGLGLAKVSRHDLAIPLYEEALKAPQSQLSMDHPDILVVTFNLASSYAKVGRYADAIRLYEAALKKADANPDFDPLERLKILEGLAEGYKYSGQLVTAIPFYEEAVTLSTQHRQRDHKETLRLMSNLGMAYQDVKQLSKSQILLEETVELSKATHGLNESIYCMNNLAMTYKLLGKNELALLLYEEALLAARDSLTFSHATTQGVCQNVAQLHESMQAPEKGEPLFRELVEFWEKKNPQSPQYAGRLSLLGSNLLAQRKFEEAEQVLRQSLAIREVKEPDAWTTFSTKSILGGALAGQQKYTEAEALLLAGYEGMQQQRATDPLRLTQAIERLEQFYTAQGKNEEAKIWRAKLPAPAVMQ